MILELEGQRIAVVGNHPTLRNRQEVVDALALGGAVISERINASTSALVVGEAGRYTAELEASRRTIPILTFDDALDWAESGRVELPDPKLPAERLDALLGEVRARLEGPLDGPTWTGLTELLDRCAPEHEAHLVDYLAATLPAPSRGMRMLHPDLVGTHDFQWMRHCPVEILRVAPPDWLTRLAAGESRPAFSLVRALVLHAMPFSNKEMITLLSNEGLTDVRSLLLPTGRGRPSQAVWRAVARAAFAPALENLTLLGFSERQRKGLADADTLRPKTLEILSYDYDYEPQALLDLFCSEICSETSELVFEQSYALDALAHARGLVDALPSLDRFVTTTSNGLYGNAELFSHAPRVSTWEIRGTFHYPIHELATKSVIEMERPDHVRELDISRLMHDPVNTSRLEETMRSYDAFFFSKLPTSRLCSGIERVRLGHWCTEEYAERFEAEGIEALA